MKHTQGKWLIQNDGNDEPEYIYCEDTTQWICQMNRGKPNVPELELERRKANAKLIAAAPELLAACKAGQTRITALEKLIFAHCKKTCTVTHPLHDCPNRCLLGRQAIGHSKVEKKMTAAIAKATE